MPEVTPNTESTSTHTSQHSWPWRSSEYVALVVMFFVCGALGWLVAQIFDLPDTIAWLMAAAASLTAGVMIYRTGVHRKRLSSFTIEVRDTLVRVRSEGELKNTHTNLKALQSIGYRQFGSDECFMLYDGETTARVPVRALKDPVVQNLIVDLVESRSDLNVSADARALYGQQAVKQHDAAAA